MSSLVICHPALWLHISRRRGRGSGGCHTEDSRDEPIERGPAPALAVECFEAVGVPQRAYTKSPQARLADSGSPEIPGIKARRITPLTTSPDAFSEFTVSPVHHARAVRSPRLSNWDASQATRCWRVRRLLISTLNGRAPVP